ncbi:MAG: AraC family transcriptional regulator [Rhodobacter sp.]|nr:AraC family transcriptional regulator [Rhodobacter sp.]
MEARLFTADDYLGPGQAFHFARKTLSPTPPRFAHRHDYFELCLVEKGAAWHWVNGQSALIGEGTLLFIRPDDTHRFVAQAGQDCRIINVMFRADSARHLVRRYRDDLDGRFFWAGGVEPEAQQLTGPRVERAVNAALELQTARRSLARIEEFLLTMMTRVVDYAAGSGTAMPGWLVAACQAAEQPEVFRRGAAGFVAAAGRGHEHVCRTAKAHLGLSPSVYVNRIRMQHAAMALGGSDLPIPEVARDCGIENLSHFYKLFRSHYGVTPRAYRRRHAKDPVQPEVGR